MTLLKKIRQNFPPQENLDLSPTEKISAAENPPEENLPPCHNTPDCTIWWYDHGDPATGTPPRLRCGTCDPPPEKSRQYVRGILRLPGAEGYEPPLPDREFFTLPCGLAEWGCTCGRPECALGRAERKSWEDDE